MFERLDASDTKRLTRYTSLSIGYENCMYSLVVCVTAACQLLAQVLWRRVSKL